MSEHKGSCLCGQLKWTITGEPAALAICHCHACRITSSASASNNFMVPRDKFQLEGQSKKYTRKGDSGKNVTYVYCAECPTIVGVDAESMPDVMIVKPGGCHDESLLREKKPDMEIYTQNRYPWVKPSGGEEHAGAP